MTVPGALGYNPDGMTLNNTIVGIITMFVLLGLAVGILWVIAVIVNKFRI